MENNIISTGNGVKSEFKKGRTPPAIANINTVTIITAFVLGRASTTARTSEAYDIYGPESDLNQFVSERDPKHIGVNFSETIAIADGISYTDYLKLVNILGEKYSERIVSAENLITDFRGRKVMSEIVFFAELCKETVEAIDKAFDLIEPGVTTLNEISRWLVNQNMSKGFDSMFQFLLPGVFVRDPDGHENDARAGDDYVIQKGDLVHIDFGTIHMNYRIDIKRLGYVLRDGEDAVPPNIQKTFDEAMRAREIFRSNIEAGRTTGELYEILNYKLEEAGYVNIYRDQFDINADPKKTQINLGFHPLGNSWPADGGGPTISKRSQRAHLKIPLYHLFVFEYMMHMPVPEWGKGKHIYMAIEDDVIVTERGVEFLYPPIKQIRLIR
jgi:Xaa-Pro aminopeptidase